MVCLFRPFAFLFLFFLFPFPRYLFWRVKYVEANRVEWLTSSKEVPKKNFKAKRLTDSDLPGSLYLSLGAKNRFWWSVIVTLSSTFFDALYMSLQ